MENSKRHYSDSGGHYLRGQAAKLEALASKISSEGRFIRPNDPPKFPESHIARRSMRRIPQSGR